MKRIGFKFFTNILLRSELVRNASILISGTVIAQLIAFLLQPFLRRFFSPEIFGIFSVYTSLIGIILVISSLRYDDAIVLPKTDKESANVLGLALIFSFCINILLFIVVLIMGGKIISFLNLPAIFPSWILYIIPLSAFLYSSYQSINYWLVRKRKFVAVSVNKLSRRGAEAVAQVSFALLKNTNGLVYSDIIGQSVNVLTVIFQSVRNGLTFRFISLVKLKYAFNKYKDFPKFNLIPAFMSTCGFMLPPIFINKFYSADSAGYFNLAQMLLSIPLGLVAASFTSVLLQRISEKYNNRTSFLSDLKPVIIVVGLISLVEIIAIVFFGEFLFRVVFGDTWIFSGRISKIMVWSFAFNFIVSTFTSIFVAMRKIKIYSIYQFFYFIAIISLLLFKKLGFVDFLRVYVTIEIICYTVLSIVMIYIIARYEHNLKTGLHTDL
jgi:O-antigen/teichoic acid export membrane protein